MVWITSRMDDDRPPGVVAGIGFDRTRLDLLNSCESNVGLATQGEHSFEHVLLLNASFEPLNVIGWRRAVKLVVLEKAEIVEASAHEVHSESTSMHVPSVVRLTSFVRFRRREAKFSRRNIYTRDNFRCQYCGDRPPAQELTCDHVIPRSRGGRTEWSNIVTCCVPCNRHKGGRTPAEAGLRLIRTPAQPTWLWGVQNRFASRRPPQAWHVYLYLDRDLETVS
jgi:5-methylcytosine-specific restriction endonuclease McrA